VHVAGQVAYDAHGRLVAPGDLTGQLAQAYRNVAIALAATGATFSDVVRTTTYTVDWSLEKVPDFLAGVERVAEELQLVPAPGSLIGSACSTSRASSSRSRPPRSSSDQHALLARRARAGVAGARPSAA
jgi:enamine deaminase RidA (YjgF/YER057c/UK114 family)